MVFKFYNTTGYPLEKIEICGFVKTDTKM
jgi:hypothetical protein